MFFIVGVQRCGTTYLYHILNEHPQIEMASPIKPEPKFFIKENEYKKGKDYYLNEYYKEKGKKILGEKSTSYFEFEKAARRIKNTFPNAKIIISLRNPVDRAISNYFFTKNNNLEPRSSIEVFIQEKELPNGYIKKINNSVSPFDYIKRSKYLKYLDVYSKIFNHSKIKIIIMEKFVGNKEEISNIYNFLNVKTDFISSNLLKKINISEKEKVSNEIYKKLSNLFFSDIIEIEKKFKLDLSIWKRKLISFT